LKYLVYAGQRPVGCFAFSSVSVRTLIFSRKEVVRTKDFSVGYGI
jgi:hypothetical protein